VPHTPIFPLAGKMSAELTDGGGATNPTVESAEPPPSVAAGDIFPARGRRELAAAERRMKPAHRLLPWRSSIFKIGRGAESCLVSKIISDTSQRPVRRFMPVTPVPLPWLYRTVPDRRTHLSGYDPETRDPEPDENRPARHPVCRTGTSDALFRASEAKRLVRNRIASPVSPEGDHFPRARNMRFRVFPSRPAPTPPHCHAWQRIRDGMGRL